MRASIIFQIHRKPSARLKSSTSIVDSALKHSCKHLRPRVRSIITSRTFQTETLMKSSGPEHTCSWLLVILHVHLQNFQAAFDPNRALSIECFTSFFLSTPARIVLPYNNLRLRPRLNTASCVSPYTLIAQATCSAPYTPPQTSH
jgi:hypothetical protein